MARVIRRYADEDKNGRLWYYYSCFCGRINRFLNARAMIKESQKHKRQHDGEVDVLDERNRDS